MTNILAKIFKFILKFIGFALTYVYIGKFFGMLYLIIWIIIAISKKSKRKKNKNY